MAKQFWSVTWLHCPSGSPGWLQDEFLFTVEGTGVLPPDEIVKMALARMRTKLEFLQSSLRVQSADPLNNGFAAPQPFEDMELQ